MARYKQLEVRRVSLDELKPKPKERPLTPRRRAALERDEDLRAALNEAAMLPSSEAVVITVKAGQQTPTIRGALVRILKAEPYELNWGVRGHTIVISKGAIPGGRGRKKAIQP